MCKLGIVRQAYLRSFQSKHEDIRKLFELINVSLNDKMLWDSS
jgi:hypothetical protein